MNEWKAVITEKYENLFQLDNQEINKNHWHHQSPCLVDPK